MSPARTAKVDLRLHCQLSCPKQATGSGCIRRRISSISPSGSGSTAGRSAKRGSSSSPGGYARHTSVQPGATLTPTFFEVTTAVAFTYFAEERVDIAVIEVGMGGTAGFDQRDHSARLRDHQHRPGTYGVPGEHPRADRRGKGRHHQARRPGRHGGHAAGGAAASSEQAAADAGSACISSGPRFRPGCRSRCPGRRSNSITEGSRAAFTGLDDIPAGRVPGG